jgi:ribosomal protein S18 acetylase RimI-like enzyme
MSKTSRQYLKLEVDEARPADYPRVARLLSRGFSTGKYALALGREADQRVELIEIMLRHRALTAGVLYVARLEDGRVAGTCGVKYDNTPLRAEGQRAARREMARRAGWLRAWWATWVLKLLGSPRLGPESCYIDNLVIDPGIRRQRVAVRMAMQIYGIVRSLGKTEMLADVISNNYRVRGLFESEGWQVVRRNYLMVPVTLPLFGFAGVYRIRKDLTQPEHPPSPA